MKNTANVWDIAAYAWLVIAMLTTKPFIPVIGLIMMTICFILSRLTTFSE